MVEETLKRYADDITLQELVRLRVENERLREALKFYAKNHFPASEGPWGIDSDDFGEVARAALKGDE